VLGRQYSKTPSTIVEVAQREQQVLNFRVGGEVKGNSRLARRWRIKLASATNFLAIEALIVHVAIRPCLTRILIRSLP
jgi:hypothetical protein